MNRALMVVFFAGAGFVSVVILQEISATALHSRTCNFPGSLHHTPMLLPLRYCGGYIFMLPQYTLIMTIYIYIITLYFQSGPIPHPLIEFILHKMILSVRNHFY